MAAQTKRILVPRLDRRFDEPVIDVAILESLQKLGYDRPTQEQAQAIRSFDFRDATNWERQVALLCFPSVHF